MKIARSVLRSMQEMGIPDSKGASAFFCICCVAMEYEQDGKPWCAAKMAHDYGCHIGSNQMAVWESMRRTLRKAKWPGTVGAAIERVVHGEG